jgi:N-acyl-D-amino-acid deacylase
MLSHHTRERGDWSWVDAVEHLSSRAAARFGLDGRGRLERGGIADIVVVDPHAIEDRATYGDPRALAVGINDVLVRGEVVLRDGELTDARPGTGLRRS